MLAQISNKEILVTLVNFTSIAIVDIEQTFPRRAVKTTFFYLY